MPTSNIYDLTDTWNAGGTTFTAIKMNVTNTASASTSLLMDLQVDGSSLFSVGRAGNVISPIGTAATPSLGIGTGSSGLYSRSATLRLNFSIAGFDAGVEIGPSLLALQNTAQVAWASGTLPSSGLDLYLARDAANTLALKNGTAAQEFRVYENTTGTIYKAILGNRQLMKIAGAAFDNGAGAAAGTLANAPAAGNPTKWIPIDDNGTTRYIPAW
jgi:hypothetical protein